MYFSLERLHNATFHPQTSLVVNVYFLVYFFVYLESVAGFKFGFKLGFKFGFKIELKFGFELDLNWEGSLKYFFFRFLTFISY